MIFFLLSLLLVVVILLEGSLTAIPLVLLYLILVTVFIRKQVIFAVAFVTGIIIDLLLVRPIGQTSAFYLLFLFFILLYERKYELTTVPFVLAASVVGIIFYGLLYDIPSLPLVILTGAGMSVGSFLLVKRFLPAKRKNSHYRL